MFPNMSLGMFPQYNNITGSALNDNLDGYNHLSVKAGGIKFCSKTGVFNEMYGQGHDNADQ